MDPLDTVGQDAHPMPEGNKVAKNDGEKKADEGIEMEITDTMPTEGSSIEGSELLEVDEVETSDEEDNVPSNTTEINESSPRVGKKRLFVIDMKDEQILLNKEVKVMEASETKDGEQTSAQESKSTEESHSNNDPHKQV